MRRYETNKKRRAKNGYLVKRTSFSRIFFNTAVLLGYHEHTRVNISNTFIKISWDNLIYKCEYNLILKHVNNVCVLVKI